MATPPNVGAMIYAAVQTPTVQEFAPAIVLANNLPDSYVPAGNEPTSNLVEAVVFLRPHVSLLRSSDGATAVFCQLRVYADRATASNFGFVRGLPFAASAV
ncbi:MAG: hypothetical protein M3N95_02570 [Actinomycetota bacterium]|nr:hypothetical protein [Actinomycetota bacterium]